MFATPPLFFGVFDVRLKKKNINNPRNHFAIYMKLYEIYLKYFVNWRVLNKKNETKKSQKIAPLAQKIGHIPVEGNPLSHSHQPPPPFPPRTGNVGGK